MQRLAAAVAVLGVFALLLLSRNAIPERDPSADAPASVRATIDETATKNRNNEPNELPHFVRKRGTSGPSFGRAERRPGEDDLAFMGRSRAVKAWSHFREKAALTSGQEDALLMVLADGQLALAQDQSLPHEFYEERLAGKTKRQYQDSVYADMWEAARAVLSDEQFQIFRYWWRPHFLDFKPIDVPDGYEAVALGANP